MIDPMERVVWGLAGRKLYTTIDGKVVKGDRKVHVVRPGERQRYTTGHQCFGSGGYSASYKIFGAHEIVQAAAESEHSGFISSTTDVIILAPMTVVYWHVGDDIGDRMRYGIDVCLGEDEQCDLEDHFIQNLLPHVSILDLSDIVRYATQRIGDAARSRRSEWLARQREMEQAEADRKIKRQAERRKQREAAALDRARRHAGDEATARSIAHLFL